MQVTAIIVAAGRGTRAGGAVPKQYQVLAGQPILRRTVDAFLRHPSVHQVVVVIHENDQSMCETALGQVLPDVKIVTGGQSRTDSVRNGLDVVSDGAGYALIHDAARPLVSDTVISRVIEALKTHEGAAPGLPVVDALWKAEDGMVRSPVSREQMFRAQTPQGFRLPAIRAAHAAGRQAADDVEVALAHGLDVAIVEGEEQNLKITRPEDFERAEMILQQETGLDIRTGNGFDVHSFVDGDHVILCGVRIPFERGLNGHSDSDVGMHALTDAIYGALALGDIGTHFPPSDDQWKGADSAIFLRDSMDQAAKLGFRLTNCDVTLICEQPKIGPHVAAMRTALASAMGVDVDRVSVKATTSEKLGFTGRKEGIASIATATLVKE